MSGYKEFDPQEILSATDVNSFLMNQTTLVFDDDADRDAQVTAPVEGMRAYIRDTAESQEYDGTNWLTMRKVLQQVVTTRTTDVTQPNQAGLNCDVVEFTPLRADSSILLEWHGQARLTRVSGTAGDFTMNVGFRDETAGTNFGQSAIGMITAASAFNEIFLAQIACRSILPATNTTMREYATRISPGATNHTAVSVASASAPSLFVITEFSSGPKA
jgi:hypothetical protein